MSPLATCALALALVGASNTYGASAPEYEPAWGTLLAQRLRGVEIRNLGVPGATARTWTSWVVFFDLSLEPETGVLFELGTNDARVVPTPESVADYERYVRWLVAYWLSHGAVWVALATPPPFGDTLTLERPDSVALLEGYAGVVHEICHDTPGALCGPDLLHRLNPEAHINADDIHYTVAGHERVAAAWLSWLRRRRALCR
jgi:lysophospholipase L1-like esterase